MGMRGQPSGRPRSWTETTRWRVGIATRPFASRLSAAAPETSFPLFLVFRGERLSDTFPTFLHNYHSGKAKATTGQVGLLGFLVLTQ